MFYTIYSQTVVQSNPDSPAKVVNTPVAAIHEDKFRITYENGDYEELDQHETISRARNWFRANLGCKFEGDVNPATGNRVHGVMSDTPCNSIMLYEKIPFTRFNG